MSGQDNEWGTNKASACLTDTEGKVVKCDEGEKNSINKLIWIMFEMFIWEKFAIWS